MGSAIVQNVLESGAERRCGPRSNERRHPHVVEKLMENPGKNLLTIYFVYIIAASRYEFLARASPSPQGTRSNHPTYFRDMLINNRRPSEEQRGITSSSATSEAP